jgi:hypothetical protein
MPLTYQILISKSKNGISLEHNSNFYTNYKNEGILCSFLVKTSQYIKHMSLQIARWCSCGPELSAFGTDNLQKMGRPWHLPGLTILNEDDTSWLKMTVWECKFKRYLSTINDIGWNVISRGKLCSAQTVSAPRRDAGQVTTSQGENTEGKPGLQEWVNLRNTEAYSQSIIYSNSQCPCAAELS